MYMIHVPEERLAYARSHREVPLLLDSNNDIVYEQWPIVGDDGIQQPARPLRDFPGVPITVGCRGPISPELADHRTRLAQESVGGGLSYGGGSIQTCECATYLCVFALTCRKERGTANRDCVMS